MQTRELAPFHSLGNCTSNEKTLWKIRRPSTFGLKPGGEVRLRYGYIIQCNEVLKNDAAKLSNSIAPTIRKPRAARNMPWSESQRDDSLGERFACEEGRSAVSTIDSSQRNARGRTRRKTFLDNINPNSMSIVHACVEPELAKQAPGSRVQFERKGTFVQTLRTREPVRPSSIVSSRSRIHGPRLPRRVSLLGPASLCRDHNDFAFAFLRMRAVRMSLRDL